MTDGTSKSSSPRRFGTLALLATLVVGLAAGAGAFRLLAARHDHGGGAESPSKKPLYQCPMHPTITADHPSDCPICGMKLVEVKTGGGAAAADAAASKKPLYQCPMHPTITADHPSDCPICGMKLVEVKGGGSGERKISFYRSPMDPKQTSHTPRKDEMGMDYLPVYEDEALGGGSAVEGLATVQIDPARQQLIGLRTAPVTAGPVGGAWRTTGKVAVDETRVHHVNVKVEGFVEHIYVDFVGRPVRRGERLFSIYSPELLSLQNEYLLAVRMRKDLAGGSLAASGDELVASARERLKLWDVPDSVIEELARTGKVQKSLTLVSPMSGVVTKKDVVHGHKLSAGDMPYEITDLSQLWVLADIYESDLARTRVGMPATFTAQGIPGKEFTGRVAFIDPVLDPKTRTVKVRLAFANPRGELKPEMFGDVVLRAAAREGLRIPADAVIDSGTQKVVFVSLGEGKFEPRVVQVGAADGDHVEVKAGLADAEQVVVRANFLVDSESRLKASLAAIGGK
ncbi:MAG: efflux RND transporter periplasmic adaptor subunit [Deltaproteobacteria bacterium]|nr:efflux RND transporter periplasmic adaptor subunit [Deltaproteobacteria bacterium]